ncbi:MAG: sigma-70 family RNA polymerase sigma factor [Kofleriaceae bacterium]
MEVRSHLERIVEIARAACEGIGIELDAVGFTAHLVEIQAADEQAEHAADLALAYVCARGDGIALHQFEQRYGTLLTEVVRTVDRDPGFVDDVLQQLRERLLTRDGEAGPPRIVRYRGTGPLGAWLRVAALRLAIDHRRAHWRELPVEDVLIASDPPGTDPVARAHDHVVVRDALRAAVAQQSSRVRTLLRFYYSENVGVEELGTMFRVHASTVSRWLARARADILVATRSRLAEILRASPSEVESHLGLVQSLEVSLGTLLQTRQNDE